MIAWHVRVTLLALLTFSSVVLLIRTQPYDEHVRLQPFLPDGCPTACFVGIQPGVTTVDEALKRLEASAWVNQIDNRTVNNVSGFISWDWSAQKPDWISGEHEGQLWATQKYIVNINIYTDLQLGDTRLALGLPDQEVIDRTEDRKGILSLYSIYYAQSGLMIQSWQPCNVIEPFRRPVILTYTMQANPRTFLKRDLLTDLYHTCALPRP